ncbi:MAG: hypothetical protein KDD94_12145, partial [Calditrichaeota bacterium]|nr:hypothetical protein [Calditrichota bacterium]
HGITYFNPDFIYFNLNKANTVLSSLQINYQPYTHDIFADNLEKVELNYDENNISLELAAIEYTNPEKNTFSYQLRGFDTDWKQSSGYGKIEYTNLNPGNYQFYVKSANNDGLWTNEKLKLNIVIYEAIWDRWWFKLLLFFVVASIVTVFYYLKMENVRRHREELENQVHVRTKELVERNKEIRKINENLENENKYRKVAESSLLKARNETDAILANINEGLFLLNKAYDISDQHSLETETLLHQSHLDKKNVMDILRRYLTEKMYEATEHFLKLLFNDDYDESIILELNPLDRVEIHIENEDNDFEKRILSFFFKRIYQENNIDALLVIVRDITKTTVLEEELMIREAKSKEEIKLLMAILKVDSRLITNYVNSVELSIQHITSKFEHDHSSFQVFLTEIYQVFHNLKSNAMLLDLDFFLDKFHQIEEVIEEVKGRDKELSGDDFLPILFEIDETSKMIENLKQLIDKIAGISKTMDGYNPHTNDLNLLFSNIESKVDRLSAPLGKRARFTVENPDTITIPGTLLDPFKDILVQLVRNSIVHSIEKSDIRRQNNKDAVGDLKLKISRVDNFIRFIYSDDGDGLNFEKIKLAAVKNGKYSQADVEKMDKSRLMRLIFEDGISTSETVSNMAGRGEGMSLVKQIVFKHKGKIKINSARGRFFQIAIDIPVRKEKEVVHEIVNS